MIDAGQVDLVAQADRTLVVINDAKRVIGLDQAIQFLRDERDALKARIRYDLEQAGKKSLTLAGVTVRLSPAKEPHCLCHRAPVAECEMARIPGSLVETYLAECEPYLAVRASGAS